MLSRIIILVILAFISSEMSPSVTNATDYYLSPSGDNNNSGTSLTSPWNSIQYAVNNPLVNPGDTLNIMPGIYHENVYMDGDGGGRCGANGKYVTIKAQNMDDKPVLTGGGTYGRFTVNNCSYVKIIGLHFKDFTSGGLHLIANGNGKVHHHLYAEKNKFENQAAAVDNWPTTLLVKGGYQDETSTLENIFIRDNEFFNVRPGRAASAGGAYNEVIALEGRVSKIVVENNLIRDSYYIGIDAKGSSRHGYGTWQAEKVVIRNNTILNMKKPSDSAGNSLYVDGGAYILLENNYVSSGGTQSNIGNEPFNKMTPELKFETYIFRNNVLDQALATKPAGVGPSYPMFLGASYCGWLEPPDIMYKTAIVHNVIYAPPSKFRVPLMFSLVEDISMRNNIYINEDSGNIYNSTEHATTTAGWESDGNLLCTNGEPKFKWGENGLCSSPYQYQSLRAFQEATDQEKNSVKDCPTFVNADSRNYALAPGSAGNGQGTSLSTTDEAGTGDVVKVRDAKYFYDGWGIDGEKGDRIRIGNDEATITHVDYLMNTLTLDKEISWGNNESVNYYFEGNTPSMGLVNP